MDRGEDNNMKKVEIMELYLLQKGACFYCGTPLSLSQGCHATSITRDHFYAEKRSINGNLVLSCGNCNVKKGHREPTKEEEYRFVVLYLELKARRKKVQKIREREAKKRQIKKKQMFINKMRREQRRNLVT